MKPDLEVVSPPAEPNPRRRRKRRRKADRRNPSTSKIILVVLGVTAGVVAIGYGVKRYRAKETEPTKPAGADDDPPPRPDDPIESPGPSDPLLQPKVGSAGTGWEYHWYEYKRGNDAYWILVWENITEVTKSFIGYAVSGSWSWEVYDQNDPDVKLGSANFNNRTYPGPSCGFGFQSREEDEDCAIADVRQRVKRRARAWIDKTYYG